MDGTTVWQKFHNPNFNRFSMIHPSDRRTDGRTDRRAIAYTRYSMLSRYKTASDLNNNPVNKIGLNNPVFT